MNDPQGEALADACAFFEISDPSKSDLSASDLIRLHSALPAIRKNWMTLPGRTLLSGFAIGISGDGDVDRYEELLEYAPIDLAFRDFIESLWAPSKIDPLIKQSKEQRGTREGEEQERLEAQRQKEQEERRERERREARQSEEQERRDRGRQLVGEFMETYGGFDELTPREKIIFGDEEAFLRELKSLPRLDPDIDVGEMRQTLSRYINFLEPRWISDRLNEAGRPRQLRKHDRAKELNPAKVEVLRAYDPFEGDKAGIFIYGETGAGKTRAVFQMAESYLARYLARDWVDLEWDAEPIFMTTGEDLSKFVSGSQSIPDAAKLVIVDDLQNFKPKPSEVVPFQSFIKRLLDDRPDDRFYLFTSQVKLPQLCNGVGRRVGWNNKGEFKVEVAAISRRLRDNLLPVEMEETPA